MKQVVSTSNGIEVIDVPSPAVRPGHVLVEVEYSFVSTGTELATLRAMEAQGDGLASDLASNPSLIGKAAKQLRAQGVRKTASAVGEHLRARKLAANRLEAVGYSCSGRVAAVGEGANLFRAGDPVACAGAGIATHCEIVLVPENLTAPVPPGCDMKGAASVAVGAIAMQGVRRADIRLGEHVVVFGLGLVGLITVQLLKLAGGRVVGLDINPRRVEQAVSLGIDSASADLAGAREAVDRATRHMGADAILITASSQSSEVVQQAMELTRKRGRVVVVGLVGMDIQRDPFLRKEIDLLTSSSYGPGRYENSYEDKGIDYPYAYVRWTEKRNMEEYLRLLAENQLRINELAEEYPLESAPQAYERLSGETDRPVAVVLRHRTDTPLERKTRTRVDVSPASATGKTRIAVVGPGRFVQRVHLPSLARMKDRASLAAIVARSGDRSVDIARRFGAGFASTSYEEVLAGPDIDAVLIGARHNLHAGMVLQALRAGKHVFVEKPLAMSEEEVLEIERFYAGTGDSARLPILLTGFNRRFSPLAVRLKNSLRTRKSPLIMNYQMNVGYLPQDHWLRTDEGGGRNIGEACHVYDLFTYLTGSASAEIKASAIRLPDATHSRNENFVANITFEDGSAGSITFTSLGSPAHPKELLHVYVDEAIYVLTDFNRLEAFGIAEKATSGGEPSKGHFEELKAFVEATGTGGEWPIPLWEQIQASRIALEVERQIGSVA
jgi:predicted dehydrogenase/threonine dehydrogenase-like Zn-dependent dehydrogenase